MSSSERLRVKLVQAMKRGRQLWWPLTTARAVAVLSDRWTWRGAVGAVDAAIARLRLESGPATRAVVKILASEGRHGLGGAVAALGHVRVDYNCIIPEYRRFQIWPPHLNLAMLNLARRRKPPAPRQRSANNETYSNDQTRAIRAGHFQPGEEPPTRRFPAAAALPEKPSAAGTALMRSATRPLRWLRSMRCSALACPMTRRFISRRMEAVTRRT